VTFALPKATGLPAHAKFVHTLHFVGMTKSNKVFARQGQFRQRLCVPLRERGVWGSDVSGSSPWQKLGPALATLQSKSLACCTGLMH